MTIVATTAVPPLPVVCYESAHCRVGSQSIRQADLPVETFIIPPPSFVVFRFVLSRGTAFYVIVVVIRDVTRDVVSCVVTVDVVDVIRRVRGAADAGIAHVEVLEQIRYQN